MNQLKPKEELSVKPKKRKKMNLLMTKFGFGKKDTTIATTRASLVLVLTTSSSAPKSPQSTFEACAGSYNTTIRY